jgi:hypothetical protein
LEELAELPSCHAAQQERDDHNEGDHYDRDCLRPRRHATRLLAAGVSIVRLLHAATLSTPPLPTDTWRTSLNSRRAPAWPAT